MKFIFDTGASAVCISKTMAEYMYDNDLLKDEDIIGSGQSRVADGRIVNHLRIKLKDIEIAGLHLKDVDAVVSESQTSPLLLGQSAIQKLGPFVIDDNKLIIQNGVSKIDFLEEERIQNDVKELISKKLYTAAKNKILEVKRKGIDIDNNWGILLLQCCHENKEYSDVIKYYQEMIRHETDFDISGLEDYFYEMYIWVGYTYGFGYYDYKKGIEDLQKCISLIETDEAYSACAFFNYQLQNYLNATCFYNKAVNLYLKNKDIIIQDILNEKIKDEILGMMLFFYGKSVYNNSNDMDTAYPLFYLSYKCGYKDSKQYIISNKIKYKTPENIFDKYNLTRNYTISISGLVDLGLSVRWSSTNLGSSNPENPGTYCCWGDANEIYSKQNIAEYSNDVCFDISGFETYDVVSKKMKNNYRTPTAKEFKELFRIGKVKRITYKGHKGFRITGPNNKSIFIPWGGYYYYYKENKCWVDNIESNNHWGYWTSTPSDKDHADAFIPFDSSLFILYDMEKGHKMNIRPVKN